MDGGISRRQELAAFLKDRRARADRGAYGLPETPRSRVRGLRREEVAALAGVSVTWYTWLEQARAINPSRQVLESIGRLFGLAPVEMSYLLALGGHPVTATERSQADTVRAHLRRLLESFPYPAFVLGDDWSIIDWNRAYADLYERIETLPGEDRNLLWLLFTDPALRELLPDWEAQARRFVGEFRVESRHALGSPGHDALIARVSAASPLFARVWAERDVEGFSSRERVFAHPARGRMVYEQHRLVPAEFPDLDLVLYVSL